MNQCGNCKKRYETNVNFCSTCGNQLLEKKSNVIDFIIAFYVSIIVFIGLSFFIYDGYKENIWVEILVESLFISLVIGFSLVRRKEMLQLYKFPKINKGLLSLYILVTIVNSFLVYYGVEFVNSFINDVSLNSYESYLYLDYPFLWALIFIAILPPIFEELAFRGFLFNLLTEVTSVKSTIIATSLLFALVHFSFISLIWIFPFGLFLGYLRFKYDSLWLPMLIHFIHNLCVLLVDYYVFNS
ncbi:CPBP family intramembrane glutamic endopeptidase [Tenacibaculum caenipelagi]|uniref:Membrane protease YdiL (CAAX protease family) n=1 Tax=Tenacibaculum caenipelagi TaxID=1325435 RepID=A0A4R6TG24_9FLAO|nr:type II CAAX endopeptidase family protein [Tenacibaculum caenipelagi]TDQ25608.1 membrane protease YdiL (CAAX protease family) [Tenacibaculum caenipelagi]